MKQNIQKTQLLDHGHADSVAIDTMIATLIVSLTLNLSLLIVSISSTV